MLVHFWIGALALYGPGYPLGDVNWVYKFWVEHGLVSGQWVGLQTSWVYPIVALLPMLGAYAFGPALYASTWLSLVMVVDAAAFAVVMAFGRDRRVAHVAWWWLGLLLALGPVALGRIDAVAVAVAVVGMLCLATAPRLAGVLLAVATWIKVWPAALVAAVVIAVPSRVRIAVGAAATSAVILAVSIVLGGGANAFSFITQQTGRGLQIESGLGTFWMWDAFTRRPGASTLYYDTSILTYQLRGQGVQTAAAVATPLVALAALALLLLAIVAVRRGATAAELLPPLALALTTALILFNKVGSPQFVTWLAVPIVLGTLDGGDRPRHLVPLPGGARAGDLRPHPADLPLPLRPAARAERLDAARAQRAQPALPGAAGVGGVEHGAPAEPGSRTAAGRRVELAAAGVALRAGKGTGVSDPQQPGETSITPFESAILEARRQSYPYDELMRAFMDTEFAVPSSTPIKDRLSDLNPPIWEIDGSPNLGVFTTSARAEHFLETSGLDAQYLALIGGRRLATVLAPDMWVAVNPTSPDYMFRIPPRGDRRRA